MFIRTSFCVKINKNIITNLSGNSMTNGIFLDRTSECIVKENSIKNLNGQWTCGINLRAENYNSVISDNTIIDLKGNWADGIVLNDDSNENTVTDNTIKKIDGEFSDGIEISDSSNNSVSNNKISEVGFLGWNTAGIELLGNSNNCTISENIINDIYGDSYSNGIALGINCNENIVTRNTVDSVNSNHLSVGINVNILSNITLLKNSIKNIIMNNPLGAGSFGIQLWKVNNFTISENLIDKHQTGIVLSECYRGIVCKNTIDNTILGVGIDTHKIHGRVIFMADTNYTTFTKNLFIQLNPPRDVKFIFQHVLDENEKYNGGIPDSYNASEKHLSNTWDQNYWYRPRLLPKKISGEIYVYTSSIRIDVPISNYDDNPLFFIN